MPGEIVIANSFDPKFISLSSPSLIVLTVFNTLGYLSQLFFRLYLKFFKNNEESNELLQWYLVVILGVAYVIPTVTILLEVSIYWTVCVIVILQFVMIPGTILLCHENVHQYYFSNHQKLHSVVLYVKQSLEKLFSTCLPQNQEPEPNLHEPVIVDDMALESNLRVIASQATARLALAQQATQNQQAQGMQTQAQHVQYSQANPHSQQPQVRDPQPQILNAHVLMLQNPHSPNPQALIPQAQNPQAQIPQAQNPPAQIPQAQIPQAQNPQAQIPQAQNPQAIECSKKALHELQLNALKPKNLHSMSEVNI